MTPTARTLTKLRQSGYIADVVEKWLPKVNRRRDCFGFADVLAAHPLRGEIILIQATTLENVSSRVRKVQSKSDALRWLQSSGRIEIWGWVRRASRWQVKIVALNANDMRPEVMVKPARKLHGNELQGELF